MNSAAESFAPHALKGQKLLAQGIALGMMAISKTPCKGKSFKDAWLEHDMIQYEKQGNCRLQSVQTIASFLYHFFYIPYSVFKKEVLSLPTKVK